MTEKNPAARPEKINKNKKAQNNKKDSFWQKVLDGIIFVPRLINDKIKIKITTKTTLMYALLYVVIIIIVGVFEIETLRINIEKQQNAYLNTLSDTIISEINAEGLDGFNDKITLLATDIIIKDSAGGIVAANTERDIEGDIDNNYSISGDYISKVKVFQHNGSGHTLYLSENIHNDLYNIKNIVMTYSLIVAAGLVIMVALGSLASAAMLKPIKQMNETIKKISAESLGTRIEAKTSQDELNELKDILNETLDELENSFLEQTRFVSDASHELRTPIAVIQGYANLLKRWGRGDPKVLDEAIEAIAKESENMKNMVDKLLFLAKADTISLKREQFILSEVLEEVVKETRMIAKNNSIEEIYTDRIEPVEIVGDKDLIKQAVRIFVDNAVKYTDDNGVIRVGCYSEGDVAVIKIVDNGIGIPAVDLPNVFERFYRCDTARTRNKGSTGLGLSIARWIIDSHEGEIKIESTEKVGTTVFVCLPGIVADENEE